MPLVADIHFDYRIALKVAEYGGEIAYVLIQAILVVKIVFVQWWIAHAIKYPYPYWC